MQRKRSSHGWPIRWTRLLLLVCWVPWALACGGESDSQPAGRSFAMGFTPWPYAATVQAVGDTYAKIQTHGDMVAHHLDGGVPWPEAHDQLAYEDHLEDELTGRAAGTDPDKIVYLAVCPLNTMRNAPADYWGTGTNQPRPSPWDGYTFGGAELAVAYSNYLLDLIDRYDPDYCNYGIEVTEYILNNPDPADAAAIFAFLQQVYDTIKAEHADLPLFISAALKSPDSDEMKDLRTYAAQISACTDIIGVSTYGYVFYESGGNGDPATLPADWLSQAQLLAPGKPLAIAETGWIAEDMVIPFYGLSVTSTSLWQADYVDMLLAEANRLNARFVTWFCVMDFDTLWTESLAQDPLARIWRDIGFYDQALQARPGLAQWQDWLNRPLL